MRFVQFCAAAALLFVSSGIAAAGKVEVTGVHLCCGKCAKGVADALSKVDGVSGAMCDRDAKTVTFTAANDEAAQAGIDALAEAGYHGTAKHGNDELEFPASGAKKDAKANSISLSHIHLCCGQCLKAVAAAANDVDGVSNVSCDREKMTCSVTGTNVSVEAVVKALNDAGFNAKVE